MGTRYPRPVRDARVKCILCNAPVAETVDGRYVCVECGNTAIGPRGTSGHGQQ